MLIPLITTEYKPPMKNESFWERDSFYQPYDLIIIGAGIVGLSSAWFYMQAHPDARVLVIDKGEIPEGASTRNAGFACIGTITEHGADLQKETEANVRRRVARRYEGLQLLRSTLGDQAIGYENCGGYEVFTSTEKFDEASGQIPRFNEWMKDITGEAEVYSKGEMGGLPVIRNRVDGALHPGKMMQQLVRKAMAAGAGIRWSTPASHFTDAGDLTLKSGKTLRAKQMLVASNGFARRIMPELEIKPARGFVMVSQPWDDIPWKGTFNYDRGYTYFRNIGNRLLLGGARNIAVDEEKTDAFGANQEIKDHLMDFARTTLQWPAGVEIDYEWSGIMGFTPTKTPVLKRWDDIRVVAAGLSGMGIAIGMQVGVEAAGLLGES